jgi:hypothetical protein
MSLLTWSSDWQGMLLVENQLLPNNYSLTLAFAVTCEGRDEQDKTVDRLTYWANEVLPGSMFADINNPHVAKLHKQLDTLIITVPSEPIDATIATCLLSKFQAITEGRAFIQRIDVSSSLGRDLVLSYDWDELDQYPWLHSNPVTELGETPWWNRPEIDPTDILIKTKTKIELIRDRFF